MDPSELRPSPRRELQGPRPTPLKVHKDSYKIKKPPLAPPPQQQQQKHHHHHQQHRDPVIIYAVSPKIIHTNPSDFMTLVQRLTGASSSTTAAAATATATATDPSLLRSPSYASGAISPAARLATFEKTARSPEGERQRMGIDQMDIGGINQMDIGGGGAAVDRQAQFPGILSPMPSSLPPISPNLFSLSDPGFLKFLHDLSPAAPAPSSSSSKQGFADNTFLISPNNFLTTPTIPSPGAYWDLFSQLLDS